MRLLLVISYLLAINQCTQSICPQNCSCVLVEKGQRGILCLKGGMVSPIPVQQMDVGAEIIRISAPEHNLNSLTIGPIFHPFTQLKELEVSNSNVPNIGRFSFWGVPTLLVLNLKQNNISSIHDDNFRGLANLQELYLDDNRIESVPSGTLRFLSELRKLTLSRNCLTTLESRVFLSLGKLKELSLSGNPLQELTPEVFKDVQELRVLECRGCGLRLVNPQIYHLLPQLLRLDLGDNEFRYLTKDEFGGMRCLQHLWLDGNQLSVVLERAFAPLTDLRYLTLSRNRLVKVTDLAFFNLSSLVELDLSINKLAHLGPESFKAVANSLRLLDLSGNPVDISELRYVLQEAHTVSNLVLRNMNLRDLPPGLFAQHTNLRSLHLDGNAFDYVPIQALPPQLSELTMTNNLLRGLDGKVVMRLERLAKVDLRENPWTCDHCHLPPIYSWLNRSTLRGLVCKHPPALEGRWLSSLGLADLAPCGLAYEDPELALFGDDGRLSIMAAVCSLLVLGLIASSISLAIWYWRHAADYYTHEEKHERDTAFDMPNNIFSDSIFSDNGELSFQFPLDLTERKISSVATIDEIKRDNRLLGVQNGM